MAQWPPTITDCECEEPGYCERHHCFKNYWHHRLCRRQPVVFQQFENGELLCPGRNGERNDDSASGPGILQRGANFVKATVRHVADGMHKLEDSHVEERLTICRNCEHCDTERMVCRQRACGCLLKLKATWRSEDCPVQKWPAVAHGAEE